eukprot:jgi/Antlo1/1804/12
MNVCFLVFLGISIGKYCIPERGELGLSESFAPGLYFPNSENARPPPSPPMFQVAMPQGPQAVSYARPPPVQFVPSIQPIQPNTPPPSPISPAYLQAPESRSFTAPTCDNSLERKQFAQCVKDALSTFKNVIENCKRVLGEDAKECCVDDRCLDSLKKKKERCMSEAIEQALSRRKDTLSEFLDFLKKEIETRNGGNRNNSGNNYSGGSSGEVFQSQCKGPCD